MRGILILDEMDREKSFAQHTSISSRQLRSSSTNPANETPAIKRPITMPNRLSSRNFATQSQHQLQQQKLTKSTANQPNGTQMFSRENKTEKKIACGGSQTARVKKAFVRFEDYLDLNEENMRRSCKRLMNHLYTETSGPLQVASAGTRLAPGKSPAAAAATSTTTTTAGATNSRGKLAIGSSTGGSGTNRGSHKSLAQPSHSPSPALASTAITKTAAPANTNGKSYLRSQYERRQQRQLHLMSKMQLEPEGTNNAHSANGRQLESEQQRQQQQHQPGYEVHQQQQQEDKQEEQHRRHIQQQDLVAKSHELSKRRFFEKLERRESIKNLILREAPNDQPISPASLSTCAEENTSIAALQKPQIKRAVVSEIQIGARHENYDDSELMLKAYETIVIKGKSVSVENTTGRTSNSKDGSIYGSSNPNMDTHGGSDGAVNSGTEELGLGLIGFCSPSSRSPTSCKETAANLIIEFLVEEQEEQRAIEKFNSKSKAQKQQVEQQLSSFAALALVSKRDESVFEIDVPAKDNSVLLDSNSLDKPDEFISTSKLLVKQVEVSGGSRALIGSVQPLTPNNLALANSSAFDRPPTLSGRQESNVPGPQMANKTKAPFDDLTDNKVEKFDVRGLTIDGRMASVIRSDCGDVGGERTSEVARSAPSHLPQIDDDNRQEKSATSTSTTISGGNNRNNNNSGLVNIISSVDAATSIEDSSSERSEINSESERTAAIEVGRELDCAKDHETPETRLKHVKRVSDSSAIEVVSKIPALVSFDFAACSAQTESAAQKQQMTASSQTITHRAIRDVLPGANHEIKEAIVSGDAVAYYAVSEIKTEQQVNEVEKKHVTEQEQSFKASAQCSYSTSEDIYANPSYNGENNSVYDSNRLQSLLCNTTTDGVRSKTGEVQLPNTRSSAGHHASSDQKQLRGHHSSEDDGSSSCSSSGFGASISDGANSIGDTVTSMTGNSKQSKIDSVCNPTSFASLSLLRGNCYDEQDHDSNPIYDSLCQPARTRLCNRQLPNSNEMSDYRQLVGPDQAYPKGRPLLVENHNYAFVLDGQSRSQPISSIVPDRDGLVFEGYANLPSRDKASPSVYATVKCLTSDKGITSFICSKRPIENLIPDESSSSRSYSTASANSGGFSALSPAQYDYASSSYNPESFNTVTGCDMPKKSSLLRKFGSLVSRAFTGATYDSRAQSPSSKIDAQDDQQEKEHTMSIRGAGIEPRTALVIERNPQDDVANANRRLQVGEADLVILQTKHVNQRQPPVLSPIKQHEEKGAGLRGHHDDRLSRGKKLSCSIRKSSSASNVDYESNITCSSYSSLDVRRCSNDSHKVDSLLQELESLVSRSKNSSHYQKKDNFDTVRRKSRSSSQRHRHKLTSKSRHIDIDCVSPANMPDDSRKETENQSTKILAANKSTGPRSLLRLLNPISSYKVAESTPNLTGSLQTRYSADGRDIIGERDYSKDSNSGQWGFSSLLGPSYATRTQIKTRSKRQQQKGAVPSAQHSLDCVDPESLVYSNMHSLNANHKLHLGSSEREEQNLHSLDKFNSLNLYQNLLQSYAKRRHRNHHTHNSHHHRSHRKVHYTTSHWRHANHSSTRCVQDHDQSRRRIPSPGSDGTSDSRQAVVSGQLIKINKSDGSQVIELQRSPGKSWGFFVARGAINNVKGIFISRMHDNVTSSSLTGLLSIGDRILAIDECPVGPDYDILRVNEMISKKSKILLKVKPFKG